MKKTFLVLLAFATCFFVSCERSPQSTATDVLEQNVEATEAPPAQEPVMVQLTTEQVRSIVHDEVAKAIGGMRLEMTSLGLPMITTLFDSSDVSQHVSISPENSHYYWQEISRVGSTLIADTVRGKAILNGTKKVSWHGFDYSIVVQPSSYVPELGCNVATFIVEVFDGDRPIELLTLSVDETTNTQSEDPLYVGRMYYRLYDDNGKPSSVVADYGTCAARLTELIQSVPELLKSGRLVEV